MRCIKCGNKLPEIYSSHLIVGSSSLGDECPRCQVYWYSDEEDGYRYDNDIYFSYHKGTEE
jgi:hypothetical protein